MENKEENQEVLEAYKKFDEEYEANEVQPYNAAYDYFYAGAKLYKEKYDEAHNDYLRSMADVDNIRKNFLKKEQNLSTFKYERLFKDMLEIFDDSVRAAAAGDLSEGAMKIIEKLDKLTIANGLQRYVPEKGEEFDEEKMEAVTMYPAGEELSHKVVDCSLSGYIYNGKVIRYPKVVVGQ